MARGTTEAARRGRGRARDVVDLALLAVVLTGAACAWKAGRERALLAARYERLVAAAGELPVEDPTRIYLRALDTGDPLHFAWRVYLPPNCNLSSRTKTGSGWSGGGWMSSTQPTEFIARVRLREAAHGGMDLYTKFSNGSSRSGFGGPGLGRLLRGQEGALKVEQVGKPGVAVIDPKAKKPTVLLRVSLPDSLRDKPPPDLPAAFLPTLVEFAVGPQGSLP